VLGLERVSIYDNFFDLGGHSLLITRLVSRLRSAFQAQLSLQVAFNEPNVANLAAHIDQTLDILNQMTVPEGELEDDEEEFEL